MQHPGPTRQPHRSHGINLPGLLRHPQRHLQAGLLARTQTVGGLWLSTVRTKSFGQGSWHWIVCDLIQALTTAVGVAPRGISTGPRSDAGTQYDCMLAEAKIRGKAFSELTDKANVVSEAFKYRLLGKPQHGESTNGYGRLRF